MVTIDDIIKSYDPIDLEYESRFNVEGKENVVSLKSVYEEKYFSFIPTRQEAHNILLSPLERLGLKVKDNSTWL